MNLIEEVARLKEQLAYKTKQANDYQIKYHQLIIELRKTQALLRQFLNANTPSSKLPFNTRYTEKKKKSKPRGKPPGSNGATKETPSRVDKKVCAKLEKSCPRCGKLIQKSEIAKQIKYIYDVIIKPEIIEVEEEYYYCDCGECCIGKHPEIPDRGMIGYNLQSLFTELKYNFSGSYGKISEFISNVTNGEITFSAQAINDCLTRVSNNLEFSYENLGDKISETKHSNVDETTWAVNGVRWWLWMLVMENFTFITIQNSRARRVLTDLFTENYQGVIISDCFTIYRKFAKWFQKCWVHLLRKVEFEMEKNPKEDIDKLYEQLKSLYDEMINFLEEDSPETIRQKKKKYFEKKLNKIINYKGWGNESKAIIKNWLIEYRGHWLTAIEIQGISLDNNIAERGIRKSIGWRKMLGGHRTREGTRNYAIIETHRQTWKIQSKSPYNKLINFLKNPVECIV